MSSFRSDIRNLTSCQWIIIAVELPLYPEFDDMSYVLVNPSQCLQ